MMTAMALVMPPRQPAAGSIAAVRAHKSLGPAVLEKGFLALCFCAVLLEKSRQRQAGLELDWVTCHELAYTVKA